MEAKDLIGVSFFLIATLVGAFVTSLSFRARDAAFFLMIALTVVTFRLDVNFHSHYWYRGTTRGLEFSLVDILAWSVLISSFLFPGAGGRRWFWPAGLGFMLLFFFYACGNVAFSDPKIYGVFELSKMLRGILFFLATAWFIRGERELAIFVFALGCAVCFEGAIALKQRLFQGIYRVPGTIDDPNSFSMYLCTVAPIFIAAATSTLPKWLRWFSAAAFASAAVSVVLAISRAGIPIFALVTLGATAFCVSWRITAKKIAAVALVALCAGGLIFKQWHLLKIRFSSATLQEEYLDPSYDGRGYYLRMARVILEDRPVSGVGLNNWSYWVSKKYGALVPSPFHYEDYDDLTYAPSKELLPSFMYAAPAHNLAALTIGELGAPGLVIFLLLWLRWLQMGASFLWPRAPDATRRLGVGIFFGIGGTFLQSITEWVFRQTHIFFTFHAMLGALAALYWLKRKSKRRRLEAPMPQAEELMEHEPVRA
jgi:O-antigen ligase